jgi:predicted alpha/beta-fold hydrolase
MQTITPNAFRHVPLVTREGERLELDDGDFLDLGWAGRDGRRLAILCHGLENRHTCNYMQGMARALVARGWDVLAWTMRGCGPESNRHLSCYNGGETRDLEAIIRHALDRHPAESLALVGFSLGGNLVLKYLGEIPRDPRIRAAVAISVPCDLAGSARRLAEPDNRLYMLRFLRKLRRRIRDKAARFPGKIDLAGLDDIRDFATFDNRYTAPLHGFRDAEDYWEQSSCLPFLKTIGIPTLVLNARNDPFLSPACHPFAEAAASDHVWFECPAEGGHVGFALPSTFRETWSEQRSAAFFAEHSFCG